LDQQQEAQVEDVPAVRQAALAKIVASTVRCEEVIMKRSSQRQASMAICVGLAAFFSCTAGAFAQAQPSPQPDPASRPALATAPSDIHVPFPTPEWMGRRYKIEAVRFKAVRESDIGWWPFSDEVMVGTFDAKGDTVSDEFGDVDSGETRHFDPAKSCIVSVRPGVVVLGRTSVCDDGGEHAPLGFRVEFWEKDPLGLPPGFCAVVNHLRAEVRGRVANREPALARIRDVVEAMRLC
jgi:hypothetical protein